MYLEVILVALIWAPPLVSGENYMDRQTIVRVGTPNKYDQYPFGTRCKVLNHAGDKYDLYIQFSHGDTPDWQLMGTYENEPLDAYTQEMLDQMLS